jgi:hypothetical protein
MSNLANWGKMSAYSLTGTHFLLLPKYGYLYPVQAEWKAASPVQLSKLYPGRYLTFQLLLPDVFLTATGSDPVLAA